MKLIVDIDDKTYNGIQSGILYVPLYYSERDLLLELVSAIARGVVLPEGAEAVINSKEDERIMMYEEKKEIRKQMSQMLADAGLNQGTIKEMVLKEIKSKVDKAVNQTIESLNAECSSGDFIQDKIQRYLKDNYINSYACTSAVKEELKNRVIQIVLKDVTESEVKND